MSADRDAQETAVDVDEFIVADDPKMRPIIAELRALIRDTAPALREAMT